MASADETFESPPDGWTIGSVHPGEILGEEIKARGLTARALALHLRVPANRITEIVGGKRAFRPRRRFGSAAISAPARSSGSIFRAITTWLSSSARLEGRSRPKSNGPPEALCR